MTKRRITLPDSAETRWHEAVALNGLRELRSWLTENIGAVLVYLSIVGLSVGAGIAAARRFRIPPNAEEDRGLARFVLQPPPSMDAVPRSARSAGAPTDFDLLLSLLAQPAPTPAAAKQFVDEFKREPALNSLWSEFKQGQEEQTPRGSLEAFAKALGDRPEFAALVEKFSQEPDFRSAAFALSRSPEFKRVMHGLVEKLAASRRTRRLLGLLSSRGGIPDLGPASPYGAAGDSKSADVPLDDAQPGRSSLAALKEPADDSLRDAVAKTVAADLRTVPLAPVPNVGPTTEPLRSQGSLCYQQNPKLPAALCTAIEPFLGAHGFWGACVLTGKYDDCSRACREAGVECGEKLDFYAACVDPQMGAALGATECKRRCRVNPHSGCPGEPSNPPDGWGSAQVLGYDRDGGRLVINEAEAAVVNRIFSMFLAGASPKVIADWLNSRGVDRKFRQDFTESAVITMLEREVYRGNGLKNGSLVPRDHPAIVPNTEWVATQRRLCRLGVGDENCPPRRM